MNRSPDAPAQPGYLVRRLAEAPSVACPCGTSTRPLTAADGQPANLHVTFMTDSTRHYHKHTTELYYVLDGHGTLELNQDTVDIEPGTLIVIEPLTRHRVQSAEGVRILIVGIPAWNPEDEYFDPA